jgi:hypothetical protein
MKSNRKRHDKATDLPRLCRKRDKPTDRANEKAASFRYRRQSTNRSTSKADYRANLLPREGGKKPTDSSRQSGFFSIDEGNPQSIKQH